MMLYTILIMTLLGGIFSVLATHTLKLESKFGVIGDIIIGGLLTVVLSHVLGLLGVVVGTTFVAYVILGFIGGFGLTTVVRKLLPGIV